MRNYI